MYYPCFNFTPEIGETSENSCSVFILNRKSEMKSLMSHFARLLPLLVKPEFNPFPTLKSMT